MRRLALSVLAVSLFAGPVWGATPTGQVFSNTVCGPSLSCSAYAGLENGDPKIEQLVALANSCARNTFGLRVQDSLFKDEMGLDYNKCLTTKTMPKSGIGATMTPKCCLVEVSGDTCQLACDLIAIR